MEIFRVFLVSGSENDPHKKGGPRYRPKEYQGSGRHDIDKDCIFYCSLDEVSAIAESIKRFRNQKLCNEDLKRRDGSYMALAKFELINPILVDLRDAHQIIKINTSPVNIATHDRETTQKLSELIYQKGADGFLWWSTIEAKWSNLSLYCSRIEPKLKLAEPIKALDTGSPGFKAAAYYLNITGLGACRT